MLQQYRVYDTAMDRTTTHEKESSLREAIATPPTTGKSAAYTGKVKNWPSRRALKSAVKRGSPACDRRLEENKK